MRACGISPASEVTQHDGPEACPVQQAETQTTSDMCNRKTDERHADSAGLSSWTDNETAKLLEAAHSHNYRQWSKIALFVGNDRSEVRNQTILNIPMSNS
eukprot:SAG11_NODE_2110_length_3805_cov_4.091203_3_plen_100_part_00